MTVSVGSNKWRRQDHTIRRTYYFSGLDEPNPNAALEVVYSLELGASIHSFLTLRLKPFHVECEQIFPFWIGTKDGAMGHHLQLLANSLDDESCEFRPLSREDAGKFTSVFCAGRDIVLAVMDGGKPVGAFTLPNDQAFAKFYNSIYDELARLQDASGGPLQHLFKRFGLKG